jgi:hypothetical protein
MATITATIFVGSVHPNDGGIIPTHYIFLSEGSKPVLSFRSIKDAETTQVILPTIENTIEDIYLLISFFFLKKINFSANLIGSEELSMYDLFSKQERFSLYAQNKEFLQSQELKIVFNLLDGCHLLSQLETIQAYPSDYEITTTIQKREHTNWGII